MMMSICLDRTDLTNNGTIMIQSGILTVTGSLSGPGVIIGGLGG